MLYNARRSTLATLLALAITVPVLGCGGGGNDNDNDGPGDPQTFPGTYSGSFTSDANTNTRTIAPFAINADGTLRCVLIPAEDGETTMDVYLSGTVSTDGSFEGQSGVVSTQPNPATGSFEFLSNGTLRGQVTIDQSGTPENLTINLTRAE